MEQPKRARRRKPETAPFVRDLPEECEIYVSSTPLVPIDVEIFIGLKLALELRKDAENNPNIVPAIRGAWRSELWHQSFKWRNQRGRAERIGDFLIHFPKEGSVTKKSERYAPEKLTVLSTQSKLLSGMPDYVPVVE
jgi:hypothetical protein